ncbi:ABC transporter permease [Faecalispora jeddahensis]|uniref:ABC transporter permease n=1 Tax=Faecalispora jeddahensis TaxID=1414721 RepID=UPI0027BA4A76|nr:ABC transporter permease [Faecalispora jeddahensis]
MIDNLFTYIRKRLLNLIFVLIGVTLLSFFLSNLSSVDPAEAFARRNMLNPNPAQIEELRQEMKLDLPLYQQYFNWIKNSLQGDLGISLITRNPVSLDIAHKLPVTMQLVGLSFFWIVLLSVPISVLSAVKKNSLFDHLTRAVTVLGISVPNFWLGFLLLLMFAVTFPVFRVVDQGSLRSLILPSLALAIPIASSSVRLFRATILSNLNRDYVIYAKARGIGNRQILWGHVLKNSLPPMITMFCQYLGYMVAGSAVVESIFSMKGIGMHLVDAIIGRDLPTINGCVLVIALLFVFFNTLADLINIRLNPRMSGEGEALYD